jgi:homoserine O-acetyltransferase
MASAIPGDHMRDGRGLPSSSASATFSEFELDCGSVLPSVTVGYNVYGCLNAARNNCVVVGHSLTSNSCVHEWWAQLLGNGPRFALDTSRYFIVCANYLGSVYGSSGPLSVNPATGEPYMASFPVTTIRDNVRVQRRLLAHLGVCGVEIAMGGSLGAMLALEWAATYPDFVSRLVAVAGCAAHP